MEQLAILFQQQEERKSTIEESTSLPTLKSSIMNETSQAIEEQEEEEEEKTPQDCLLDLLMYCLQLYDSLLDSIKNESFCKHLNISFLII